MNFLDFGLTKCFLSHTEIEECHPVARYIIDHNGGIGGLAILKSSATAVVLAAVCCIARKKPVVARNVLMFGTVAVGLAVWATFYSLFVYDAEREKWSHTIARDSELLAMEATRIAADRARTLPRE